MYYKVVIIAFLICPKFLFGQINLIPNPSFEEYDTCPWGFSQICNALPWFQPNVHFGTLNNSGSSDLWNSCYNDSLVGYGVPTNWGGYQYPLTGQGYAAIAIFNNIDANTGREYIEVKLNSPLVSSNKYCVSFYVSLGDNLRFGSTGMGAFFSLDSLLENSQDLSAIILEPQVYSSLTAPITDTINWVEIYGEFIAEGGEQFLTIGNFFEGDSIIYQLNDSTGQPFSYYYIDDVSVYACDTGIGIIEKSLLISKLYTTQNGEWVFENSSNKGMKLEVFNSLGQQVFKQTVQKGKQVFYPNLQKGIYYWQANEQRGKMVVE